MKGRRELGKQGEREGGEGKEGRDEFTSPRYGEWFSKKMQKRRRDSVKEKKKISSK